MSMVASLSKAAPDSRAHFHAFLDEVQDARVALGFTRLDADAPSWPRALPRECFYRGHSQVTFQLLPTLLRSATALGWNPVAKAMDKAKRGRSLAQLRDLEAQLFYEFKPRARKLEPDLEDDWDVLFLMRHHGVATRVLDWTQSLGVALHFALWPIVCDHRSRELACNDPKLVTWARPHVWLLNAYRMNRESWGSEEVLAPRFMDDDGSTYGDWLGGTRLGMPFDLPVAVLPELLNARLNAQRGAFTLHGNLHAPMEVLLERDTIRRVDIPLQALPAAIEFLENAGLNESILFPDLDALARDLHRKYRL